MSTSSLAEDLVVVPAGSFNESKKGSSRYLIPRLLTPGWPANGDCIGEFILSDANDKSTVAAGKVAGTPDNSSCYLKSPCFDQDNGAVAITSTLCSNQFELDNLSGRRSVVAKQCDGTIQMLNGKVQTTVPIVVTNT